ncbi:transposase [Streptomyces prasinus]|uniref:transposase n=1 Tax=Streptomyces prasinus TaxID=67345 RepID=UPI0007C6E8D7
MAADRHTSWDPRRPETESDHKRLQSFVVGIRSDLEVVTAGLTLPFSSGAVEGQVNRIKMLKRQMFGRAGVDLLRKRILLSR